MSFAPTQDLLHATLAGALSLFALPAPALPSALCRLLLGGVLAADGIEHRRRLAAWHGEDGLFDGQQLAQVAKVPAVLLPALRLAPRALSSLHVLLAVAFTLGIATKPCGILLWCSLVLTQLRNPFILYGGDALARVILFGLLFSPCDRAVSIDAWITGNGLGLGIQASPWGMRLIQLELLLLYSSNFVHKITCAEWRDGRAVRMVLCNADFAHARVPGFLTRPAASRCMTYGTLAFEGFVGLGLCVPATRALAFSSALLFHAGISCLMNVHLFGAIMIAGLMTFVPVASLVCDPSGAAWSDAALAPLPIIGLAAIGLYAGYVVWAYWPRRARRIAAHEVLLPTRNWALFAPPGDEELEWEIVALTSTSQALPHHWTAEHGLQIGGRQRRWGPGHRSKRFEFSVFKNAELRAEFVRAVRRLLRRKHGQVRALAVNALIWKVPDARSDAPALKDSIHIALALGIRAGVVDLQAAVELGRELRCDSAYLRLLELIVRCASDRERSAQAFGAVRAMLNASSPARRQRSLPTESRNRLSALLEQIAQPMQSEFRAGIARVFDG